MSLNVAYLAGISFPDQEVSYDDRDTMLYAVSVGFDPAEDSRQLPFVYEKGLVTAPTMASLLGHPRGWTADPATGVTVSKVVHGEQRMEFHRPLPPAGRVLVRVGILGVENKGEGALIHLGRWITDPGTGEVLATVVHTSFCRADGGFGAGFGESLRPHTVPSRAPSETIGLDVPLNAATLYRLNGDRNPLHIEPDYASRAGYPRPIVHGLYTYGAVARAVLGAACGYDPALLRRFDVRFTGVVFPGDHVAVSLWHDGPGISFRAAVGDRVVLDNGLAVIGA